MDSDKQKLKHVNGIGEKNIEENIWTNKGERTVED
jgi:hypothetical protein